MTTEGMNYQHAACGELCYITGEEVVFFHRVAEPQGVCPTCKVTVKRHDCVPVTTIRGGARHDGGAAAQKYISRQLVGA
jgi:hypothetical protein